MTPKESLSKDVYDVVADDVVTVVVVVMAAEADRSIESSDSLRSVTSQCNC